MPLTKNDIALATLPLFHSFAQTVIQNGMIAIGGTIVLLPRFDPGQALALMQKHQVTFFAGVPTMYFALLHAPKASEYNVSTLRFCVAGGSKYIVISVGYVNACIQYQLTTYICIVLSTLLRFDIYINFLIFRSNAHRSYESI